MAHWRVALITVQDPAWAQVVEGDAALRMADKSNDKKSVFIKLGFWDSMPIKWLQSLSRNDLRILKEYFSFLEGIISPPFSLGN